MFFFITCVICFQISVGRFQKHMETTKAGSIGEHHSHFDDPKQLIADVRAKLHDGMAPEANRCFEYAMKLFEQLEA